MLKNQTRHKTLRKPRVLSHPKGQEVVTLLESHVWSAQGGSVFFGRELEVGGCCQCGYFVNVYHINIYIYICVLVVHKCTRYTR